MAIRDRDKIVIRVRVFEKQGGVLPSWSFRAQAQAVGSYYYDCPG